MNLVEGILEQCNRVRALIPLYEMCGPGGAVGVAMMRQSIAIAESALSSGDVIAMMASYKDLEDYKE